MCNIIPPHLIRSLQRHVHIWNCHLEFLFQSPASCQPQSRQWWYWELCRSVDMPVVLLTHDLDPGVPGCGSWCLIIKPLSVESRPAGHKTAALTTESISNNKSEHFKLQITANCLPVRRSWPLPADPTCWWRVWWHSPDRLAGITGREHWILISCRM